MSVIKHLAFGIVAALLSGGTALAECKPEFTFPTVEKGYLTIAASSYAPYSFIDTDGKMRGVDGEILAAIAAKACLELKPVPSDAGSGIQSVISGKADVTTGDWYRTAERARVLNLSAPLYVDQMGVYSKQGAKSIKEIEGGTVGSVQGNLWITDLKKVVGERLKLYPNSIAMQQDLLAGRLDAAVDGASIGIVAQGKGELKGIQIKVIEPDERVAASREAGQGTFPLNKKNTEMLEGFDKAIATLHQDGTIAKILVANGLAASAAETGAPRLIK